MTTTVPFVTPKMIWSSTIARNRGSRRSHFVAAKPVNQKSGWLCPTLLDVKWKVSTSGDLKIIDEIQC